MFPWTFVSIVLLVGSLEKCSALKCMECADIPHPSYCDKMATCQPDSHCMLTQYITSSGAVLYSSGCSSSATCGYLNADTAISPMAEDETLDITVCKDCCNSSDFCNLQGCGQQGVSIDKRGPYCYECSVENEQYGCRTITQCGLHESCYLDTGHFPDTFRSGCTDNINCTSPNFSTHLHKRWLSVSLPFCCTGDFCNDITKLIDPNPNPVNGSWSVWSDWSSCTHTCGNSSVRTRSRTCDSPAPTHKGLPCHGVNYETDTCSVIECPVNGSWSAWNDWSTCPQICGNNSSVRARNRTCDNPAPQHNGQPCIGIDYETVSCGFVECPIDGGWSSWYDWSLCSHSCGPGGMRARAKKCDNPSPQYNGKACNGSHYDTGPCPPQTACNVNGSWSAWGAWSSCSVTCGFGFGDIVSRKRTCDNPAPVGNGLACVGKEIQSRHCGSFKCPVNGSWSDWGEWSHCAHTCGFDATISRNRTCDNPAPQWNGTSCNGNGMETKFCAPMNCPVNGGWSSWGRWSGCSKTCDTGTTYRNRTCNNPVPQHHGHQCHGDKVAVHSCLLKNCPVSQGWSEWSRWTHCSTTCGPGLRTRDRNCLDSTGCGSHNHTSQPCELSVCAVPQEWSEWSQWTHCSTTCGPGLRTRDRNCLDSTGCGSHNHMSQPCELSVCAVPQGWSTWSQWTHCSTTCGPGLRTRDRNCLDSTGCGSYNHMSQPCELSVCAVTGGWTEWSPWTVCVGPCHQTKRYRFRQCRDQSCHGHAHDAQNCNNHHTCDDSRCRADKGFHVVMVGGQRLCLYLSEGAYTWDESRARCYDRGGDLVSIGDRDADFAIRTFLQGRLTPCGNTCYIDETHSYTWFGLRSTSSHHHSHGLQWTNQNVPFHYDDLRGHTDSKHNRCIVGGGDQFERWYNVECDMHYTYLCEKILD